jgi:hypothetical protein
MTTIENNGAVTDDEFPFRKVIPVMVVTLAEGFTGSVLFPFVAFMVISFGFNKDNVGFVAGFLTTAFFLGQFVGTFG